VQPVVGVVVPIIYIRAVRREPVTRSAQATAAVLAMLLLLVGIVGVNVFGTGLGAFCAGLIVGGIGMELYTRALGAWVARDDTPWAIANALIGSPAVFVHALLRRTGPIAPEPGALAGLLVPVGFVAFIWALASA
jgi:hypothetical protein